MTDVKKTAKKKSGAAAGKKPAQRDAYDEFLDAAEKPASVKKSSSSKKSGKSAASAGKAGAASGRTKVEPGIGMPPDRSAHRSDGSKKKTSGAADPGSKSSRSPSKGSSGSSGTGAKKAGSAAAAAAGAAKSRSKTAVVEENPVASGRSAEATRSKSGSGRSMEATRSKSGSGRSSETTRSKSGGGRSSETTRSKSGSGRSSEATRSKSGGGKSAQSRSGGGKKNASRKQAVMYAANAGGDAYDEFLRSTEEKPRRNRKKRNRVSAGAVVLAMVLLVGISGILGLGVWQHMQYLDFRVMKEAVSRQTFYEGTTVDGVDLSGMTLQQALEYWKGQIEPGYSGVTVSLSNGASFTAAELGYGSDYETVLTNAWSAGRKGSLTERYAMVSGRRENPVSYTVTRRLYQQDVVDQCVAAIAEQIDRPAEDSQVASFDITTYQFSFTDEQTGAVLDRTALTAGITQALQSGGGTVELVVNPIEPSVRKAEIATQYGMITYAVTNASSSSRNRLTNIRLAMELINGTCLAPGETFSFNGVVGKRTTDRGFRSATAYSGGEVTEDVGGGICQVSTTLFNAAVKAGLEIVERHNHSLTVGYVDLGKDAAVNWNSQDLRFTNTTGDDIYICCILDGDKRVRIGVFGRLLPNGETITVEARTTGKIPFETEYRANPAYPTGASAVTQAGKDGYTAEAYVVRWDANGREISRELLCTSRYKYVKQIVEYGP